MKTPLLLFVGLCACVLFTFAQHPTCDGSRYKDEVFTTVNKTSNIKFGENTTFSGATKELFLDVYEPDGDAVTNRPVAIFAFGGSFISGDRSDVAFLCNDFAKRGYVAVAIDYRIIDGIPSLDTTSMIDAVVKAVMDMKASVRFMRESHDNGNPYGIDPNQIFVGGISAGGITAAHTAYLDSTDNVPQYLIDIVNNNGGYEGNSSSNTQYSSKPQGVLNYSGALKDASWVDVNDPPAYSAHDDADNVVPYSNYSVNVILPGFTIYMEGSETITNNLDNLGIAHDLYTVPNSTGHVSYFNSSNEAAIVLQQSADFIYEILCGDATSIDGQLETFQVEAFPSPTASDMQVRIIGEHKAFDLQVLDVTGRTVYEVRDQRASELVLPRTAFATGLHYLHIDFQDADVKDVSKKILFR